MDIVKKIAQIVLFVAIMSTIVNDGVRYVKATYQLESVTREAAARSLGAVKASAGDRTIVWQAGETYAQSQGATIYGFDLNEQQVHIWTRMPIKGTWVLHRIASAGKPQAPEMLIEDEASLLIPAN